ncbi:MAG: zinc ribbon domain-containing protein [Candidatus Obscuribacterales bacterium]|nr:zinc ribbon domain-containing protein [Candidatus Obscuribacterales bacterium]
MSNTDSTKAYTCPSCSTENRDNAKFCRKCGHARKMDFAGPNPTEAVVCHSCATEVRASDLFCLSCGAKQGQRPPKEKHCTPCNKPLPAAANFCTTCGTKVADATVVPPRTAVYPNLEA